MEYREQILDECQWLFNQEVRIITFKQTEPRIWHAIVVPRACSLQSLSQHDINGNILIRSSGPWLYSKPGTWNVYTNLLTAIAIKTGEILQFDSGGLIQFNSSAIPAEYNTIAVPAEPVESSSPQIMPKMKEDAEIEKGIGQEGQEAPVQAGRERDPKGDQTPEGDTLEREWVGVHGEGEVNKSKEGDKVLHSSNLDIDRHRSQALTTDGNTEGRKIYLSDLPGPRAKSVSAQSQQVAGTGGSRKHPNPFLNLPSTTSTQAVDDTASDISTAPRSEPFDPTDPYQQMMRHEIKSSMRGLLKCLTEYIEET